MSTLWAPFLGTNPRNLHSFRRSWTFMAENFSPQSSSSLTMVRRAEEYASKSLPKTWDWGTRPPWLNTANMATLRTRYDGLMAWFFLPLQPKPFSIKVQGTESRNSKFLCPVTARTTKPVPLSFRSMMPVSFSFFSIFAGIGIWLAQSIEHVGVELLDSWKSWNGTVSMFDTSSIIKGILHAKPYKGENGTC